MKKCKELQLLHYRIKLVSLFRVAANKTNMLESETVCKVQRVKVAANMPPKKGAKPIALEEMKVLSEKDIKDFLSKDIVDAGSDAEDYDNSSSESIQHQSAAKPKKAESPKKLVSRKPILGKAESIFVGPPPPIAGKSVGLRMTEDGWVELDFAELGVDDPVLLKWSQPDDKS